MARTHAVGDAVPAPQPLVHPIDLLVRRRPARRRTPYRRRVPAAGFHAGSGRVAVGDGVRAARAHPHTRRAPAIGTTAAFVVAVALGFLLSAIIGAEARSPGTFEGFARGEIVRCADKKQTTAEDDGEKGRADEGRD